MSALSIAGDRVTGKDIRTQNVMAVLALANIVKSSLGPVGLDKMLVDEVGDVTITNDGATILKLLEVEHPAARVLVNLSSLQDSEVGDGTTSVVILASELLKQANQLVMQGVHPTAVISGLLIAKKEACKFIARMSARTTELGESSLMAVAKTSMASKIISGESKFFAEMAFTAVKRVEMQTPTGKTKYPISAISILKAHGQSLRQSELVNGYALNCTRASQGMVRAVQNAKIALLDIDLRKSKMALGVQVVVTDPSKLQAIRKKESDLTRNRIQMLIDAGANVVFTTKGIDDQALKIFVENKMIAIRRVPKKDMRRLANITGGKVLLSLANLEGEESFDAKMLGIAESVSEEQVGDGQLTYIRGCNNTRAQTIVLRGANDFMLDEVERSLHDSLCAVKRTMESKTVVPGGGCVEGALSVHMSNFADSMGNREQLAVQAFADACLIIPKTLAVNGACDVTRLIAELRSAHYKAQNPEATEEEKRLKWTGLDLFEGIVRNNLDYGVLEPTMSKIKSIRFAIEAAVTILRIDDCIKMTPANDPNNPVQDGY
jgi:T-complex protein 1 subunit alpha